MNTANSYGYICTLAALCMHMYVSVHGAVCDVTFISLNYPEKQMNPRRRETTKLRRAARKTDSRLMSFDANNARSLQIKSIWSLEILCN